MTLVPPAMMERSADAEERLRGFPGRLRLGVGTWRDYLQLAHFHYTAGHPAGPCGVVVVWHETDAGRTLAGAAVLARPTLRNFARERALPLPVDSADRARWVNMRVRTIARVIVHPTYRSLGISTWLVQRALRMAAAVPGVRYVEASARMARVHPLFECAGMTRMPMEPAGRPGRPAYYYVDLR